jgi:hypothetical protein
MTTARPPEDHTPATWAWLIGCLLLLALSIAGCILFVMDAYRP